MSDYRQLQQIITTFRDERQWDQYHLPKNMIISLWVEVGELAEHFQYWSDEELLNKLQENSQAVAEELVDVLWWVLLMGHDFDIDLGNEFKRKMLKNSKEDKNKGYARVSLDIPESSNSLTVMIDLIVEFRRLRGWHTQIHPRDLLLKMFEEVGELAEYFQWKKLDEFNVHIQKHKEDIADELIDVLICTLLLFHHLGYDIEAEFHRKMKKNADKYPLQ